MCQMKSHYLTSHPGFWLQVWHLLTKFSDGGWKRNDFRFVFSYLKKVIYFCVYQKQTERAKGEKLTFLSVKGQKRFGSWQSGQLDVRRAVENSDLFSNIPCSSVHSRSYCPKCVRYISCVLSLAGFCILKSLLLSVISPVSLRWDSVNDYWQWMYLWI